MKQIAFRKKGPTLNQGADRVRITLKCGQVAQTHVESNAR
jgi:hypothetical protein